MKKSALLMGLMVVSAVAGGSFAYGWYSVTNIPGDPTNNETVAESTAAELEEEIASQNPFPNPGPQATGLDPVAELSLQLSSVVLENGQISLALGELQLSQLVNDAILSQPQAAKILANAQSLQTVLKGDLIETGAVLNLAELPRDGLSAELQSGLDQLTQAAPMLANRDIYIGISARPQVQDGQISLDQDLGLRLGQFTLPLADVAEQMGFSTSEIEQTLNDLLEQKGVTLENIQVLEQQLVITGSRP